MLGGQCNFACECYANIHTEVILSHNKRVIGIVSSVAMKVRIVIALVHQLLHFNCGTIVTLNNNDLVSDITGIIIRKRIHNSVTLL